MLLVTLFVVIACGGGGGGESPSPEPVVPDAGPVDAAEDARPLRTVEGELHFLGCKPAPMTVTVNMRAVRIVKPTVITADPPAPPPERLYPTQVLATGDARTLKFRAEGVPDGELVQIGVDVAEPTCGARLAWRGPTHGFMIAQAPGSTPAPRFEGAVVRSRVEILATRPSGQRWVSADFVPSNQLSTVQIRVKNEVPGAIQYELQLSTEPFPTTELGKAVACALAKDAPVTKQRVSVPAGDAYTQLAFDASPASSIPIGVVVPPRELAQRTAAQRGAPVYIRAVPVLASGEACDAEEHGLFAPALVSAIAPVATGSLTGDRGLVVVKGTYTLPSYPYKEPIVQNSTCYRVIEDHQITPAEYYTNPIAKGLANEGFVDLKLGDALCYTPPVKSSSWFDDVVDGFGELASDIIDAVAWAVNNLSRVYNEIKEKAITIAANVVKGLTGCEDPCRIALELATDYGLAAMGLPPSLPNFDQLVDQGLDYLAAEIANQTGAPQFIVDDALNYAKKLATEAKAQRGTPNLRWLVPDSGYRPAVLTLEVQRGNITIPAPKRLRVETALAYVSADVDALYPNSGTLAIPIVMQPNTTGLQDVPPVATIELIPGYPFTFMGGPQHAEAFLQWESTKRLMTKSCITANVWGAATSWHPVFAATERDADLALNNVSGAFNAYNEKQCTP